MSIAGTRPAKAPGTRPVGTAWLVLRQYRLVLATGLVLLVAAAAYILWWRADMAGYLEDHPLTACDPAQACDVADPAQHGPLPFLRRYGTALEDTAGVLIAVPALVGVFLGAPLAARDLETGTYKLLWTQSVSRSRWLAVKFGLVAAVTAVGTGVLSALFAWWWSPALPELAKARTYGLAENYVWYGAVPFHATGLVFVALALLALTVGVTAGLLLRRTLPAMAGTLALVAAGQWGLGQLLPRLARLMPLRTGTARVADPASPAADPIRVKAPAPGDAWIVRDGFLTDSGNKLSDQEWGRVLDQCPVDREGPCVVRHGVVGRFTEYHPSGQFWPLQWIEAGICLAAAAALAAFCLWRVRRRPA
ncbi:translation initiation factor IF-2 [Streptomyces sp. LZ34]